MFSEISLPVPSQQMMMLRMRLSVGASTAIWLHGLIARIIHFLFLRPDKANALDSSISYGGMVAASSHFVTQILVLLRRM